MCGDNEENQDHNEGTGKGDGPELTNVVVGIARASRVNDDGLDQRGSLIIGRHRDGGEMERKYAPLFSSPASARPEDWQITAITPASSR